jgi:hypothetical protein
MALQLWLPIDERPRYLCGVCGSMMLSPRSYELHVAACVREHEAELARYRHLKKDNIFGESADPEYREWQRDNPLKADKEKRQFAGGTT